MNSSKELPGFDHDTVIGCHNKKPVHEISWNCLKALWVSRKALNKCNPNAIHYKGRLPSAEAHSCFLLQLQIFPGINIHSKNVCPEVHSVGFPGWTGNPYAGHIRPNLLTLLTMSPNLKFTQWITQRWPKTSNQKESHNTSSDKIPCNSSIFDVAFFFTSCAPSVAGISQPGSK